jgi:hypothetical protein
MWLHHNFEKVTLQVRAAPPPAERGKMLSGQSTTDEVGQPLNSVKLSLDF